MFRSTGRLVIARLRPGDPVTTEADFSPHRQIRADTDYWIARSEPGDDSFGVVPRCARGARS